MKNKRVLYKTNKKRGNKIIMQKIKIFTSTFQNKNVALILKTFLNERRGFIKIKRAIIYFLL